MRRIASLAALAGVLAVAAPAHAQNDCNIICSPVFVNQSGVIVTNFIDTPEGVDSDADFLLRFTTAFGTQWDPLFLAFLVQWTPFNDVEVTSNGETFDFELNAPTIVYGPGLHIFGGSGSIIKALTNDYIALDLLPLVVYIPDGEGKSAYHHIFTPEADLFIKIGNIVDPNNKVPYIHNSNIYVILDYLSDALGDFVPEGTPSELEPSRWVLLFGLTVPIAPIPGG